MSDIPSYWQLVDLPFGAKRTTLTDCVCLIRVERYVTFLSSPCASIFHNCSHCQNVPRRSKMGLLTRMLLSLYEHSADVAPLSEFDLPSSCCKSPLAVRVEVCGVDRLALIMPCYEQRCRLHGGQSYAEASRPSAFEGKIVGSSRSRSERSRSS